LPEKIKISSKSLEKLASGLKAIGLVKLIIRRIWLSVGLK